MFARPARGRRLPPPATTLSASLIMHRLLHPWLHLLFLTAFASPEPPPTLTVAKTEVAPALDGEVVSDPFWQQVAPTTTFRQTSPDDGRPVSERTEVRVVATGEALYFAVVCFDREPDRMVV